MVGREREQDLGCLFVQGHKSCHEGALLTISSKPSYVPMAPTPSNITLEILALTYEFGEGHNSV